jgi:hypothetical protein
MDLLSSELQELGFADFDVGLIGFEPKDSRQSWPVCDRVV